jgi:hypothetical protein
MKVIVTENSAELGKVSGKIAAELNNNIAFLTSFSESVSINIYANAHVEKLIYNIFGLKY